MHMDLEDLPYEIKTQKTTLSIMLERIISVQMLGFVFGFILSAFGFWLGGYDLLERGGDLGLIYVESLLVGVMGALAASALK